MFIYNTELLIIDYAIKWEGQVFVYTVIVRVVMLLLLKFVGQ